MSTVMRHQRAIARRMGIQTGSTTGSAARKVAAKVRGSTASLESLARMPLERASLVGSMRRPFQRAVGVYSTPSLGRSMSSLGSSAMRRPYQRAVGVYSAPSLGGSMSSLGTASSAYQPILGVSSLPARLEWNRPMVKIRTMVKVAGMGIGRAPPVKGAIAGTVKGGIKRVATATGKQILKNLPTIGLSAGAGWGIAKGIRKRELGDLNAAIAKMNEAKTVPDSTKPKPVVEEEEEKKKIRSWTDPGPANPKRPGERR